MKKLILPVLFLTAALLTVTACASKTTQPTSEATVIGSNNLIAEGRLLPANTLDLSFSIAGQVAEVLVKDGEVVKTGQVLARLAVAPDAQTALVRAQQEALAAQQALDSLKASADVTLAQANLALIAAQDALDTARSRYEVNKTNENEALLGEANAKLKQAMDAQKKLEAGAGVDPDQLASAQARLASANAGQKSAQALVDAHELKASMDGTVANITLQAGQKIAAGQTAFTLADFTQWVVKTDNLSEIDVVKLRIGQKVSIVLDALPGQSLSGEVTHINLFSEEKRGDTTYTVTVVLSQSISQMRWGMTAAVQFIP
jgi:multidrug resistance efflux pump